MSLRMPNWLTQMAKKFFPASPDGIVILYADVLPLLGGVQMSEGLGLRNIGNKLEDIADGIDEYKGLTQGSTKDFTNSFRKFVYSIGDHGATDLDQDRIPASGRLLREAADNRHILHDIVAELLHETDSMETARQDILAYATLNKALCQLATKYTGPVFPLETDAPLFLLARANNTGPLRSELSLQNAIEHMMRNIAEKPEVKFYMELPRP